VINSLKEAQNLGGREWVPLNEESKPIGALPGFDSPAALLFTCGIEEALGLEVPEDENLCVLDLPNGRRRARSIREIAERVSELLEVLQASHG
jgi:hypothetical protein